MYRILYIEDDKFDQRAVVRFFKSKEIPYELTIANGVEESLRILATAEFDAILCDFNLSDGTALDILDIVSKVPVIIVTGGGDEEIAVKAMKQGAYEYIVKDFNLNYIKVLPLTLENAIKSYAAKEKLRMMESVVIHANDAIIITEAGGDPLETEIVYINDAFTQMTGYQMDELSGKSPAIFRGKKTSKQVLNDISKSLKNNNPVKAEMINYHKNGNEFWLDMNIVPIFDDDGQLTHYVSIQRDITKRKRAEQQLIKAKNIAIEARQAEEHFVAVMSHEIRTPLNAIVGMSELLLNTKLIDDEQVEYLNTIKQSTDILVSLINDVLDYSKIKAGKIHLEKSVFSIIDVVKNVVKTIKFKADEKNIAIVSPYDLNIPDLVVGDSVRLNQILLNLMSNAVKFTHQGQVELKTKVLESKNNNTLIEFSVVDTGIGIPDDQLDKIFDRFSQVGTDTNRKYGGTGLGLSIVKQLVEMQGGSIKVKSKIDQGSQFVIQLPFTIAKDEPAAPTAAASNMPKNLHQLSILLAEDNKINQRVASKILEQWNTKVSIANHGKEAVEMLEKNTYDVLLLDLQMPEMDGFETAAYIREQLDNDNKRIPIIALTAAANVDKQMFLDAGFNEYVAKPFDTQRLYDILSVVAASAGY